MIQEGKLEFSKANFKTININFIVDVFGPFVVVMPTTRTGRGYTEPPPPGSGDEPSESESEQ